MFPVVEDHYTNSLARLASKWKFTPSLDFMSWGIWESLLLCHRMMSCRDRCMRYVIYIQFVHIQYALHNVHDDWG